MKVLQWSLALLVVAVIATSCGQPKSNRKLTEDADPQAAALIQQTSSSTNVDTLMAGNNLFSESNLDSSDQGLVLLAYVNGGESFTGNIFYGSQANPYKGEQMTLSFDKRTGSSYIYVNIMSGRGNVYTGIQPTQTSEINVSYHKIRLHENSSCLIVENTIASYEAVVCKQ